MQDRVWDMSHNTCKPDMHAYGDIVPHKYKHILCGITEINGLTFIQKLDKSHEDD